MQWNCFDATATSSDVGTDWAPLLMLCSNEDLVCRQPLHTEFGYLFGWDFAWVLLGWLCSAGTERRPAALPCLVGYVRFPRCLFLQMLRLQT